jgi:phosphoglycerol transferase MdoB-like AlkP superfamily enzyme
VQSESLFDAAKLAGAEGQVYLPNYHRLVAQGRSGELRVPTYGGGTIRTEFEVLTGLRLDAFPRVRYPYLELTRHQMPGLVRVLTQHGYKTTAIHPNSGAFWNRASTFKSMGFNRFIDSRDFPPTAYGPWFVTDAALTDRILEELSEDGPPQFILAISLQNHGPYMTHAAVDPRLAAAMPLPPGLSGPGRNELRNYLVLAQNADRQLARLAEAVSRRTRPTLLLFYGDHLPALSAAFGEVGFADGRTPAEQTVPWLLLDNRADAVHRREDLAAWQLPGLLLSTAGMEGGRYFAILEAFRRRGCAGTPDSNDGLRQGLTAVTQMEYHGALDDFSAGRNAAF